MRLAALFVLIVAVSLAVPALAAPDERRVALVIGNAAYQKVPGLTNPQNDARDVAAVLAKLGAEVIYHANLDKVGMEKAIGAFGDRLKSGSTGIFYYAGHAMQVQGHNYLIPVDAAISAEQRVRLETVDIDVVLDQMAHAKARVSIVILDACRNNPFERKFRSSGGGLAQINAPEGTLIAYATAPGQVASDGEGQNGLYTAELIRFMQEPGRSVEEMFKRVRVAVSRRSNGEQVPWESSSLTGDFYFAGPPEGAGSIPTVPRDEPVAVPSPPHDGQDRASIVIAPAAMPAPVPPPVAAARPVEPPRPLDRPRPVPGRGKGLNELECRTVPVEEVLYGYKITKFGTECQQPDGSWRTVH